MDHLAFSHRWSIHPTQIEENKENFIIIRTCVTEQRKHDGREQAREPDSTNVTELSSNSKDWQRLHQHLAPTERERQKNQ